MKKAKIGIVSLGCPKNQTDAEVMLKALADKGICVSQKSACSIPNTPSKAIMAIYNDKNRALSSFRISLSYQTTKGEIEELANAIKEIAHE